MFRRASAIRQPGMFLSQPPMATTPSKRWALLTNSIESAITSRLGSENFMPSVPIEIPSLTVMVPKICGTPPPTRTPSRTFSARRLICELQGVISLHVLATPISGLLKSSSVSPTARSIERLGARSAPSVIILLRLFKALGAAFVDPFVSGILTTLPFLSEHTALLERTQNKVDCLVSSRICSMLHHYTRDSKLFIAFPYGTYPCPLFTTY